MAKPIRKGSIRRSRELPTTGDGYRHTQKPKLSETNLGGKTGWLAKLIRRSTPGGKHS